MIKNEMSPITALALDITLLPVRLVLLTLQGAWYLLKTLIAH